MKTWEKPEVAMLEIGETQNGGKPSMDFDQQWYDENGALHVNFRGDEEVNNPSGQ